MLDFYLANKDYLEFPIESDYIGTISRREFELIGNIISYSKCLGIEFSAHSDFFIQNENLVKLSEFVSRLDSDSQNKEVISARLNFSTIVTIAINKKLGVYAFCD